MKQPWSGVAALGAALATISCRCGPVTPGADAGGSPDAGAIEADAGGGGPDGGGELDAGAGLDGGPDAGGFGDGGVAWRRSMEVVTGGGRITSGTKVMDVQIGHGVSQAPASSGTRTIEGNAAVKR